MNIFILLFFYISKFREIKMYCKIESRKNREINSYFPVIGHTNRKYWNWRFEFLWMMLCSVWSPLKLCNPRDPLVLFSIVNRFVHCDLHKIARNKLYAINSHWINQMVACFQHYYVELSLIHDCMYLHMTAFQINDTFGFQSGVKVKVAREVSENWNYPNLIYI